MERDNGSGVVWEWFDTAAGEAKMRIVRAVAGADDARVRYVGQQYHHDRIIPAGEKAALRRVLAAYDAMLAEAAAPADATQPAS